MGNWNEKDENDENDENNLCLPCARGWKVIATVFWRMIKIHIEILVIAGTFSGNLIVDSLLG